MARLSLKSRVVSATALVVVCLTLLLILVARHYSYTSLETLLQAQQDSQVRLVATEIDDKLQTHAALLRQLAEQLAPMLNRSPATLQSAIRQTIATPQLFDRILLIQPDGKPMLGSLHAPTHTDYANRAYFRQIKAGAPLAISRLQGAAASGAPEIVMAVPVRAADGRLQAVVAASLNLQRENFLGRLSHDHEGKTAVYCLVSTNKSVDHAIPDGNATRQPSQAIAGNACGLRITASAWDFTGLTKPIVARYPVKTAGWELIAAIPASEAFSPLTRARPRIFITAIFSLAGAVLLMWLLVRHLLVPLEQLHQVVKKSATDWSAHTRLPLVRADEIGDLTTSFASVMQQLAERTSALQAARDLAKDREQRLEAIANQMPDLVAYLDTDERYVFANRAYEKRFGVPASQIVGRSARQLWGERIYAQHLQPGIKAALSGQCATFDIESRVGVDYHCFEVTYQPAWNSTGDAVIGIHGFARDVTHERRTMQRLERKAQSDSLTGLLNRTGFDQCLASAMTQARTTGKMMALLLIDLDNFKQVNDTYGHAFGDALLKIFAARLKACARDSDAVARIGGDEFAVILEGITNTDATERVAHSIVAATSEACIIDGRRIECGTSVGAAHYDESDSLAATGLFLNADTALYAAKRAGKGRFVIFEMIDVLAPHTNRRRLSD